VTSISIIAIIAKELQLTYVWPPDQLTQFALLTKLTGILIQSKKTFFLYGLVLMDSQCTMFPMSFHVFEKEKSFSYRWFHHMSHLFISRMDHWALRDMFAHFLKEYRIFIQPFPGFQAQQLLSRLEVSEEKKASLMLNHSLSDKLWFCMP
jgi:hypothetical protein